METTLQQHCLTTRGVVTTEDIGEELVSQEPLLLVPEELSITTSLAKERLHPLFQAAGLPDLQVHLPSASIALLLQLHSMAYNCARVNCAENRTPHARCITELSVVLLRLHPYHQSLFAQDVCHHGCILWRHRETVLGVGHSAMQDLDAVLPLALFLAHEHNKGQGSFWQPYLDLLPQQPGCAWLMPPAELADAVKAVQQLVGMFGRRS